MGRRCGFLTILLGLSLAGAAFYQSKWDFAEVSKESGVDLIITSGAPEKKYLVETMGGGVCVLDYDSDGWPDLFFSNGTDPKHWNTGNGPTNHLFRNLGNGGFSDITQEAGLQDSGWSMGCVAADYDGDGDIDLYVTNFGKNVLYENDGRGHFRDVTGTSGTGDASWSTGATFGDLDGDGDLDLYVANYVEFDLQHPAGDPRFCSYRGVTVACGPRGLPGAPDTLYRNDGSGKFTDISKASGIRSVDSLYGFQPVWTDIDLDGDLDVFVANDSTPNFLWRNNGDSTLTESALLMGLAYNYEGRAQANMGVDVADLNGDGRLDIYSTNFSDDYNVYYRNSSASFFTDETFKADLAQVTFRQLGFATLFGDFDNDSLVDIFAANGHIYPEVSRHGLGSTYSQANQLFHNLGNGRFEEIGTRLGSGLAVVKSSRGAAFLDWDKDGDLDLVVTNMDDRVDLLRNDLSPVGNYLQIVLQGQGANPAGIGSRVTVTCGESTQTQELHAGSGFLGNSQPLLHFGLGKGSLADKVEVVWPSGQRQSLQSVKANQPLVIRQKE